MKKLLITAFTAVALVSSAFAAPVKGINYFVANSFKTRFPNVSNVEWIETGEYAKATFVLDNIKTEALYELDGDFIGTCHAIAIEDLPVAAKRTFAKKYNDYTVKEAIKFDGIEESAYFISAQNNKQSVVLKVIDRSLSVYTVSNRK